MSFQEKLMNQTRENGKKPSFRSDFDCFGPNLSSKNFFSDFISTRYQKLLQVIIVCNLKENWWTKLEKMAKKPGLGLNCGLFGPNLGHYFFFQKLVPSVTRSQIQLSSCTISETNNDSILRKLSDSHSARVILSY